MKALGFFVKPEENYCHLPVPKTIKEMTQYFVEFCIKKFLIKDCRLKRIICLFFYYLPPPPLKC